MLKKTLKIFGIIIVALIAGFIIMIFTSGEELPPETNEIIAEVIDSPVPEFITGQTGFAKNGDVKIWYESNEPEDSIKGSILLSMGIANDAMAWPPAFISGLVKKGYRVIRYDHRGCGLSDWMENWSKDNAYSLSDMSNDGLAVLDALFINEAHFVGVSMGGMIAQQTAIEHPYRVKTLTSIMSSGFIMDPDLPEINMSVITDFVFLFLKYGLFSNEKKTIKLQLASRYVLMGDSLCQPDIKSISQQVLYNIRNRKAYNTRVSEQHNQAVLLSGSRYEGLKKFQMPVLIIHGISDPFVPIEHGIKCSELIPYSKTLWVEGMGHDIPNCFNGLVINNIISLIE